jgi:hypothetical protein
VAATVHGNLSSNHIKSDRDFFNEVPNFNGTSGIGTGTLANRPVTCTPGVAYWATNQGTWNTQGNDGVLYKCISTNAWVKYYEPYTYPHPMQIEIDDSRFAAPANLRIVE